MRFCSKAIEIDAEQFLGCQEGVPLPDGVQLDETGNPYVVTIHEQRAYLSSGDWIIQEPGRSDRHYPCKPAIFEQKYRPAGKRIIEADEIHVGPIQIIAYGENRQHGGIWILNEKAQATVAIFATDDQVGVGIYHADKHQVDLCNICLCVDPGTGEGKVQFLGKDGKVTQLTASQAARLIEGVA